MKRWWIFVVMALLMASCEYETIEKEVGYKGEARLNPWLALERYCSQSGRNLQSSRTWENPSRQHGIRMIPASMLNNEMYIRQGDDWVEQGGHLIVLFDYTSNRIDDWSEAKDYQVLPTSMVDWLGRMNLTYSQATAHFETVEYLNHTYALPGDTHLQLKNAQGKEESVGIYHQKLGRGDLTLIADARMMRNRFISEPGRIELVEAMLSVKPKFGGIYLLKGTLERTLWDLLHEYAPHLIGTIWLLVLFWLWKISVRKAPVLNTEVRNELRGFEHHLAALGEFYCRTKRGQSMIQSLRLQVVERAQIRATMTGQRDEELIPYLMTIAPIPSERLLQAIVKPVDGKDFAFTQVVADLQHLLTLLTTHH